MNWPICISKLNIIGSDNGLSPGRHQAITWTNVDLTSKPCMCVGISGIHLRAIECSWSYSITCFQNQRNLHFKNYYHIPQGQWVNTKHDISHPWTCHICFTCAFKLSIPVYHSSSIAPLQSDWDGAILPGLLIYKATQPADRAGIASATGSFGVWSSCPSTKRHRDCYQTKRR